MTTITIDQTKCIGCGQCVNDCFPKNLRLEDGKAVVGGPCMECGHCYAVCPTGAVTMEGYATDSVLDCKADVPVANGDALLHTIKMRRSIRQFMNQAVEPEAFARIIEAGRFTPTGGNMQDVCYTVVQENLPAFKDAIWEGFPTAVENAKKTMPEGHRMVRTLERLLKEHRDNPNEDGLFFNAPAVLIMTNGSMLNAGLAASNVELMAHAVGLGVLYSGFIRLALANNPALCDKLGLKPAHICVCMLVGYPAVAYQRTAPRKEADVKWF